MSRERFEWLGALGGRPGRHHPDARHREQRQGDLRRVRRARARPGERHLQPVLRVREPPRPLGGDRARARAGRRVAGGRPSPGCVRRRSSRPPGPPGRSARGTGSRTRHGTRIVAVEALECPTMLRNGFGEHNIQGIGDKHIPLIHNVMNTDLVVGDLRPGDGPAPRALQHRRPGAPTSRRGACPSDVLEALAGARHLLDLQHPRRDQDGEAAPARPGGRGRHRRDRRRRDVPAPRWTRSSRATSRPGSARSTAAETFGRHMLGAGTRRPARADAGRAGADLQPRLLHVGGAAGRLARRVRGAARPGVLARPSGERPRLGRGDRRDQRAGRVGVGG